MSYVLVGIIAAFCSLCVVGTSADVIDTNHRSFRIDTVNNQFLMNDQPFRIISGSFHYFRALSETWQRKLRTMRAAGLNAVTTYVEWSLHNPKYGDYAWDGMANLERFIQLARQEDLYVILRPGPYICAERDLGGHPYWLLGKYPTIKPRTNDADYLREVRIWYGELMPRINQYLYGNGGPIIMVQIENEYGSFSCDRTYRNWMYEETKKYVGDKAVLFTNDGPSQLPCGKIDQVLATLDFGAGKASDIDRFWQILRHYQPNGPLMNSEYYPGWLTHWQERLAQVDAPTVVTSLKYMLDQNVNINFYMFFGGTNFGFTAGANDGGIGKYEPDLTSYDYDAPMDEAGDPTPKYMMIRDVIKDYVPMPNISVPVKTPKMRISPLQLYPRTTLLSVAARRALGKTPIFSVQPVTFESLDQYSGFVLYETILPHLQMDPSILSIPKISDRAIVLMDDIVVGVLSRGNAITSMPISLGQGSKLQILVENQGRINYGQIIDFKGIIGDVLLNNVPVLNWTITGFPLDHGDSVVRFANDENDMSGKIEPQFSSDNNQVLRNGPAIFHCTFDIKGSEIYDTYIDTSHWGKGVIFINGFNIGRYWPLVGPQITLYVPKELLRESGNSIVLLELQRTSKDATISFSDKPIYRSISNRVPGQ